MLDHSDPVASITPAAPLDSPPDNAMRVLSRLALGPVNTDYYLAVFDRFDNTGRTTTTWNWAACLSTINWMVFRQLWSAALVYLAAAGGLALVLYALGRSLLQWPLGIGLGVLGAFAVLAFAVPGLYGNAILYADIRKRVGRALAASRTLPEACAVLQKQASTRKLLHAVVLANIGLLAAAALAYLLWPSSVPSAAKPLALEPALTVAQTTAAAAAAASASASAPAPAAASGPVTTVPEAAPGPLPAVAAVPEASASGAMASPSTPAPAPAPAPARSPAAPIPPSAAAKASASAVAESPRATASVASKNPSSAAKKQAPARAAAAEPASAPAAKANARPPKPAAASTTPTTAATPSSTPLPSVGATPGYYINVGLFAEEANARKTQARLLNEGLPAFRQELQTAKGRRIRVRVGPYDSRARADAAAATIRAMSLEAVVFKQ